jgi:uncharacterized membrane protein YkvA (DUF1232 family)
VLAVTIVTLSITLETISLRRVSASPAQVWPVSAASERVAARTLPRTNAAATAYSLLAQPIENRLSAGTTQLLRSLRKRVRQVVRRLRYGIGQWSTWLGALVVFLVLGLVLPLLGRDSWKTFREEGLREFLRELSLALAVYIRLLIDGRTPMIGKALLAFALAYGASGRDIFPDGGSRFGLLDDLVLLVLVARSFMLLCPQEIVEEHAMAAAHAREQNLQKKLRRRRRAAKTAGPPGSPSTESS